MKNCLSTFFTGSNNLSKVSYGKRYGRIYFLLEYLLKETFLNAIFEQRKQKFRASSLITMTSPHAPAQTLKKNNKSDRKFKD